MAARRKTGDDMDRKRLELHPAEMKRLSEDVRDALVEALELEDMGELSLSIVMDALVLSVGKAYYNRGLSDARRFIEQRAEDIAALEIGR